MHPMHASKIQCSIVQSWTVKYNAVKFLTVIYWKFTLSKSLYPRGIFCCILPCSIHNKTAKGIIIAMVAKHVIISMLGLDSGYTVKYSSLPLGYPSAFGIGNSLRHTMYFPYAFSGKPPPIIKRCFFISLLWT